MTARDDLARLGIYSVPGACRWAEQNGYDRPPTVAEMLADLENEENFPT